MANSTCPLCEKHRGIGDLVGPVIYEDGVVHVAHRAAGPLGYVFVDTMRHVAYVDELTDAEARAVGWARSRIARAFRAELDIDFVHAMVVGTGVAHFHEHVFGRHAGTPDDYEWWRQWEGGPVGDVEAFARRLQPYFRTDSPSSR
jgi:ATP adenylyltransferase